MAKKADFANILIRQGIISEEQLGEAKRVAKTSGKKVPDQLVVLGYATGDEVMRAIAQEHGLDFIDLNEVVIPPSIVELLPESALLHLLRVESSQLLQLEAQLARL